MSKAKVQQIRSLINRVGSQTDECLLAEHQEAIRARDLDDLIHNAIKGFRRIKQLRVKGFLDNDQMITLSRKPQEFGQSILNLIESTKVAGYEIEREQEFRSLFADFILEVKSAKDEIDKAPPGITSKSTGVAAPVPSCDVWIDMCLLAGIIFGLLISTYSPWSVWVGFFVGIVVTAVLCALGCSLKSKPFPSALSHG